MNEKNPNETNMARGCQKYSTFILFLFFINTPVRIARNTIWETLRFRATLRENRITFVTRFFFDKIPRLRVSSKRSLETRTRFRHGENIFRFVVSVCPVTENRLPGDTASLP